MEVVSGTASNFKVMPQFKVRSEGDCVYAGDEVIFITENVNSNLSSYADSTLDVQSS